MFQATKIRMAPRVASGMWLARGAASNTITASVMACTMPATGVRPPARTLVTVRAIVPVAAIPPNNGLTRLAMPCAISS